MRTFEKMTVTKSYKVAMMDGSQVKYVGRKLSHQKEDLVDLQEARVFKYKVTAKKYMDRVNARTRLAASGKNRNRNIFYIENDLTF